MTRLTLPVLLGALVLAVLATAVASASRARTDDTPPTAAVTVPAARAVTVPTATDEVTVPQPAARLVPNARRLASADDLAAERRARPRPKGFSVAKVRSGQSVALRARPGGRTVARAQSRTEFGGARVLSVADVRGDWLGVTSEQLPNGELAWVKSDSRALDVSRTQISLRADLSRRTLELRKGRKTIKTIKVSIGRPGSSTPTGRFAVTDKLSGSRFGPYYGCCILALSGTQPNLPAGWKGGNRLAIHGTNAPGTIGKAASAGCLRAADAPLRTLMRSVPVGTPVFIGR